MSHRKNRMKLLEDVAEAARQVATEGGSASSLKLDTALAKLDNLKDVRATRAKAMVAKAEALKAKRLAARKGARPS